MNTNLTPEEVTTLRHAPGRIADGGETDPALWDLERRGYLRPVFSYNPAHYRSEGATRRVWPHIGYSFDEPVYAYTRTEFGEVTNAIHIELEGGERVDI